MILIMHLAFLKKNSNVRDGNIRLEKVKKIQNEYK